MAFKDKFLAAIDKRSGQAKDLMSEFNSILNDIDWEAKFDEFNKVKKDLLRKGSDLFSEMNDFLDEIKETVTDFSVIMPYNVNIGEKYDYKITEGNILVVTVTYDDGMTKKNYVTEAHIPDTCDIELLHLETTKDSLVITIPKRVNVTSDTVNHIEDDENNEKCLKKEKKTQPLSNSAKESIEQIAKKLAQKTKGKKSIFKSKRFSPKFPTD